MGHDMGKWIKGDRIKHPVTAADAIINGETLFHNHKPQNAGWLQNWSIVTIRREVSAGRLFLAIPNPEESK